MEQVATGDLLQWIPKGVLLGLVVALSSLVLGVVKHVVSKTHGEIMNKFEQFNTNLLELKHDFKDSLKIINDRLNYVVTLEYHKEAREELSKHIEDLRRRVERLEHK
jgi:polyhydroxyalkanoate synthesis regulator phasin